MRQMKAAIRMKMKMRIGQQLMQRQKQKALRKLRWMPFQMKQPQVVPAGDYGTVITGE